MSKAFVREDDADNGDDLDDDIDLVPLPVGSRNYITPAGYQRLHGELVHLLNVDRPEVVGVVSWAASNGDRSENGDYIYGKKRLREIDRRGRFLIKRPDRSEGGDPPVPPDAEPARPAVFRGPGPGSHPPGGVGAPHHSWCGVDA